MTKLILQVILLFFSRWLTLSAEKREKRKEAFKEVTSGIKDRDTSRITRAFDGLR